MTFSKSSDSKCNIRIKNIKVFLHFIYLNIVEMQMIAVCYKSNSDWWGFLAMLSVKLKKKKMGELLKIHFRDQKEKHSLG